MIFVSFLVVIFLNFSAGRVFGSQLVELTWGLSTNSNIAAYRVFYGTQSGIYTNSVLFNDPSASDVFIENLQWGTFYYFAVQAIDSDGNNSALSEEATFVPPVITPIILQSQIIIDDQSGLPQILITGNVSPPGAWQLESSTNLQSWIPTGDGDGDSSTSSVYIRNFITDGEPQKFFRVQRL